MLYLTLSFTLFIVCSADIAVGPVSLKHGQTIMYHHLNASVLLCPYTLPPGDALASVKWEMIKDDKVVGSYKWTTDPSSWNSDGLLEDHVKLGRADSSLEVLNVTFDFWATYTCTITSVSRHQGSASQDILVLDSNGMSVGRDLGCSGGVFSLDVHAMFPRPHATATIVSSSTGVLKSVEPFNQTFPTYSNGSIGMISFYEIEGDRNLAEDTKFNLEVVVVRKNGEHHSLSGYSTSIQSPRGCVTLEVGVNQTVNYSSRKINCYGEFIFPSENEVLKADVVCSSGTMTAQDKPDKIAMVCVKQNDAGTEYKWIPEIEGSLPEDLQCVPVVEDDNGPGNTGSTTAVLWTLFMLPCLLTLW